MIVNSVNIKHLQNKSTQTTGATAGTTATPGKTASSGPASPEFKELLNTLKDKVDTGTQTSTLTAEQKEKMKKDLSEQCQNFEAIFTNYLFKFTEQSSTVKGYLNQGDGQKDFQSMLNDQRAQDLAQQRPMGIGKMLLDQLVKNFIK